jgi:hypothetical protein
MLAAASSDQRAKSCHQFGTHGEDSGFLWWKAQIRKDVTVGWRDGFFHGFIEYQSI